MSKENTGDLFGEYGITDSQALRMLLKELEAKDVNAYLLIGDEIYVDGGKYRTAKTIDGVSINFEKHDKACCGQAFL